MGPMLRYVFVPEDDSVVIGSTRYMLSVINLDGMTVDPNSRPYPPVFWPQAQYWQFANRHNPYLDVGYVGDTQTDRVSRAEADTARIGLADLPGAGADADVSRYRQQHHDGAAYLRVPSRHGDASGRPGTTHLHRQHDSRPVEHHLPSKDRSGSQRAGRGEDHGARCAATEQPLHSRRYGHGRCVCTGQQFHETDTAATVVQGKIVTNLAPNVIGTNAKGIGAIQSQASQQKQESNVALAATKTVTPQVEVTQSRSAATGAQTEAAERHGYQSIYGFSVYNSATGRGLPGRSGRRRPRLFPTRSPTPPRMRTTIPFTFASSSSIPSPATTCRIIVPSMVHDQYGHFAHLSSDYQNVLSKTNQIDLGYLYSIYDSANNFDSLNFSLYGPQAVADPGQRVRVLRLYQFAVHHRTDGGLQPGQPLPDVRRNG